MRATATIVFVGRFQAEHFLAFVDHRARRLDLSVRLGDVGPERIAVAVAGEPDLIDAFEMACSLGPIDCLVYDVVRSDAEPPPDVAAGPSVSSRPRPDKEPP